MIPIDRLRRMVKSCDPARALSGPDDPFYVDLDGGVAVRGPDGQSCVGQLLRTLQLAEPTDETCQLFTGFPGSGKTTELHRLERMLHADTTPTRAIYVDFDEYIDRYTPISIGDVLRVLAYALDREATLAEAKDPDATPGYLARLLDFLRTDVQVEHFNVSTGAVNLLFELRDNPSFRQKLDAALANRFQLFARDAQQSMAQSVLRLRKATGAERVVVLADSLEKITPLREEDRHAVESSVESLFLQHARLMQLPCHVVYTFPFWLGFRTAGLGAAYRQEPVILPMVRIAGPDGRAFPEGERKLVELVGRRVGLDEVFGPALEGTLLPLARASGGYPRDLLRMVRELLTQATSFPVSPADCEAVIARLGEDYADVVRSTDLDLLAEVDRTHALPAGDEAEIRQFGRLLERWLVLAYRNGRRWYALHPLVARAPTVRARLDADPPTAPRAAP